MNALLTLIYPALLKQSAFLLARYPNPTLQPEDLLHMAMERILRRPPAEAMQVAPVIHGLVATTMRRVLVNEWRRNTAFRRRTTVSTVPLEEASQIAAEEAESWPEVIEALAALRTELPEAADVVEMRFFHGVTQSDMARSHSVSKATVSRRWLAAAAWLRAALAPAV